MKTMTICSMCGEDFSIVGDSYERKEEARIDYYCLKSRGGCGAKLKPVECIDGLPKFPMAHGLKPISKELIAESNIDPDFSVAVPGITVLPPTWYIAYAGPREKNRVLYIPDLHAPFMHKDAIPFLKWVEARYKINKVVQLGDLIDNHYSSFHDPDPDGNSAGTELDKAVVQIGAVAEAFPNMDICLGNHDRIPNRKAFNSGLSKRWVKSIKDLLLEEGLPVHGWNFSDHFVIDGIVACHGDGRMASARSHEDEVSVIQGHYHKRSYLSWEIKQKSKIFAMQLGALIDDTSFAFAYAKKQQATKLNCGITIDGVPQIVLYQEYLDYIEGCKF